VRFDVITLFPELFEPFTRNGINRRAYESGALSLHLWPLRDHATDAYRRVDDRPFGGGPGMVMLYEPLARALAAVRDARAEAGAPSAPVVLFSPAGETLSQAAVRRWAAPDSAGAVLICGRYEGVDQRFIDRHVDVELSIGDYVLSGGELPALVLLDAVARVLPGVLGDPASHLQDSFEDGLLDCPHYSRPEQLPGEDAASVPDVLLSGNHAAIARWRRAQQVAVTAAKRPDVIQAARRNGQLSAGEEAQLRSLPGGDLSD